MSIPREDIEEIMSQMILLYVKKDGLKDTLRSLLDDVYVSKDACDHDMQEVEKKLSNDSKELAVINTKLSLILWMLGAVGASVITVLIKILFGM
jgi:hypothetical protein